MASNTAVQNGDKTWEDRLATTFVNALADLTRFTDLPALDYDARDVQEQYHRDADRVPFEATEGTAYGDHVRDIVDWARSRGLVVSVDSEVSVLAPLEERFIVNLYPSQSHPPVSAYVFCEVDGAVEVELRVAPVDDLQTIYDGPLTDLDVDDVREAVDRYRPFVTQRVRELINEAGVNPSHARAAALREAGLSQSEVAKRVDVTTGAVGSYLSKLSDHEEQAEHLFVSRHGASKRVLAKRDAARTNYLRETRYVCEELPARTDYPVSLVTVTVDSLRESGSKVSVSTETFPSLEACINTKYATATFDDPDVAEDWRALFDGLDATRLSDAGFESLPASNSRLSAEVP